MTDDDRHEGRVRALVVPPDGPGELRWLEPSLSALQGVLEGGWLEGVGPAGDGWTVTGRPAFEVGWHAYCDEEGKLKQLPVNLPASLLAFAMGWPHGDLLCGTVVFLGNGEDGDEADVPQEVLSTWQALHK